MEFGQKAQKLVYGSQFNVRTWTFLGETFERYAFRKYIAWSRMVPKITFSISKLPKSVFENGKIVKFQFNVE